MKYTLEEIKRFTLKFENTLRFPDGTFSAQVWWKYNPVLAVQGFPLDEVLLKASAAKETGMLMSNIVLYAPYIPSRQDRICNEGEPFTARAIADFINWLGFKSVVTVEPHSDVLPALIRNCQTLTYSDVFDYNKIECLNGSGILNVVAPDAGAIKRTEKFIQSVIRHNPELKINLVQGIKKRDLTNGKITSIKVDAQRIEGPCLVVDDVCAMGGTFHGTYDALKKVGAEDVNLLLAHADARNGLDGLAEKYNNIYVTNSQKFEVTKPNIHITDIV